MMVLLLGDLAYSYGELERGSEIGELESTTESRFAGDFDNFPVRKVR